MGYEGAEFTQYEKWTPEKAKETGKLMDRLHMKVFATHTEPEYFVPGDKMKAANRAQPHPRHAERLLRERTGRYAYGYRLSWEIAGS